MTEKILLVAVEQDLGRELERLIKNGLLIPQTTGFADNISWGWDPAVWGNVPADDVEFITFSDGREAIHWCGSQDPDLVITGDELPGMNGLQFIQQFRELPDKAGIPVLMIAGIGTTEIRYQALASGATDLVNKPVDMLELALKVRNWLACRRERGNLAGRAKALMDEARKATDETLQSEQEIIFRLSKAVEYREIETGGHILRVAHFAKHIAGVLSLPENEQNLIFKAAPLHDVGKAGIPDRILRKRGNLNKDEYEILKRHTIIGHRILQGSSARLLQTAADIALTHHERYNGSGYPQGLHGTEIPLYGRIVALADVFDALTTTRGYKKAWEINAAFDYLVEKSGKHFDPDCVKAFLAIKNSILAIKDSYGDS